MEEVKKELNSYIQEKKYLEQLDAEIEEYRTKATSCTAELSDMPKANKRIYDKVAEYAAIIADLEYEKIDERIKIEKQKKLIEDKVKCLDQPYKNILYFKYIKGYDLTEVAKEIRYEYKYTCSLHGKALKQYQEIKHHDK